jgi:acetyltransferase-like isoleucine patch superfamily enzyme
MLEKPLSLISYYSAFELANYALSFLYSKLFLHPRVFILHPFILRNKKSITFCGKFFAKSGLYLEPHVGAQIIFGSGVILNRNCYITASSRVSIGKECLIGPNVFISDHDHGTYKGLNGLTLLAQPPQKRLLVSSPITIMDRVWIGANVSILKGVTIGENTVIGANSVVSRSLPPNSVCVGSPCKVRYSVC